MDKNRFSRLRAQSVSQAVSYRFVFEAEGWAIFTLNDATGELLITSDWGNYGYRWDALGNRTLHQFLAEKGQDQWDCHYIIGKLRNGTNSKNLEDVVDCEKTRAKVSEEIRRARSKRSITAGFARELWEQMERWAEADFNHEALEDDLAGFLSDPYYMVEMGPSGWFRVWAEELMPWFCAWLRENVVNKPSAEVAAHV